MPGLLSLGLSLALLAIALRSFQWDEFTTVLGRTVLAEVVQGLLVLTGSFLLRGLRWQVLLSADRSAPPLQVLATTMVGYLGNDFLPARSGDVIRALAIGQYAGISRLFALATILVERVVDAAVLVLLAVGLVLFAGLGLPPWAHSALPLVVLVVLLGLGGLLLAARLRLSLGALNQIGGRAGALLVVLRQQAYAFQAGIQAFNQPRRLLLFALLTGAIWTCDIFFALQVSEAVQLSLSVPQAVLLIAALGLASAVPSTPGYVGVYQFVAVTVLGPFGYSVSEAIAYIAAFQALSYAIVIWWGGLALGWLQWGSWLRRPMPAVEEVEPARPLR
ncbi:MAG: flippase-like domain-containing protein [Chloroflexi bacterium]|nr:flippase-like domain-containing protein [Chloroflexota bacterium]